MGDGRIFLKSLCDASFNEDLWNEPNLGWILLAEHFRGIAVLNFVADLILTVIVVNFDYITACINQCCCHIVICHFFHGPIWLLWKVGFWIGKNDNDDVSVHGPYSDRNYLRCEALFVKEIRRAIEWFWEIKTADQWGTSMLWIFWFSKINF